MFLFYQAVLETIIRYETVVARGMGKCCVAGCGDLEIDYKSSKMQVGSITVVEGDYLSIDGSTGEVMLGKVATKEAVMSEDFKTIMAWSDSRRKLRVYTNADTPEDAAVAFKFAAEGIGLCRTEHMFFQGDRIKSIRELILVADELKQIEKELHYASNIEKTDDVKELEEKIKEPKRIYDNALNKIMPMQKQDFIDIFKVMKGYPVTIRLLDPPLHEFIPHEDSQLSELAKDMNVSFDKLKYIRDSLHEFNPMLGLRGCRLGIVYPEIYDMQAAAIIEAAIEVKSNGGEAIPEIMVPLVGNIKELAFVKKRILKIIDEALSKTSVKVSYKIGTMIEVPRAAITADEIASISDFFSFGTNDLTQLGSGFSRDDAGKFLKEYVEDDIYDVDPFKVLDMQGIGRLMKIACEYGRGVNSKLKIGICGEHGGEPNTVMFCHDLGLNYVSCSPYRVPIARLAAAQGAIREEMRKEAAKKSKKTVAKKVAKKTTTKKAVKKSTKK